MAKWRRGEVKWQSMAATAERKQSGSESVNEESVAWRQRQQAKRRNTSAGRKLAYQWRTGVSGWLAS